jgi:heat shock protein HslJ
MRARPRDAICIGAAAVALVLVGCGGDDASTVTTSAPWPEQLGVLADGAAWELVEGSVDGDPIAPVAGHPITMMFEAGALSGSGGCNSYGTEPLDSIDGEMDFVQTLMACGGDIGTMEERYLRALAATDAGERDGDALVLTGPSITLTFAAT